MVPAPKEADASGPAALVSRGCDEVSAQRGNIHRHIGHRLAGVQQQHRPHLLAQGSSQGQASQLCSGTISFVHRVHTTLLQRVDYSPTPVQASAGSCTQAALAAAPPCVDAVFGERAQLADDRVCSSSKGAWIAVSPCTSCTVAAGNAGPGSGGMYKASMTRAWR